MQDPFEEHPSHEEEEGFPLWRTIDQVSRLVGVTHDTVRREVHKAFARSAPWVKRTVNPATDRTRCWLIDTSHEEYQAVAHRWRAYTQRTAHSSFQDSACSDRPPWDDLGEEDEGGTASPLQPSQPLPCSQPEPTFEIVTAWPLFCAQLAAQGLVVFHNILASDGWWHWSWHGHTAEGYDDPMEAVIAALRWHLLVTDDAARSAEGKASPEEDASGHRAPCAAPYTIIHRPWWQRLFDWLEGH